MNSNTASDGTSTAHSSVFEAAYSRFYSSLSANDRRIFSPCASSKDLLEGVQKLQILSDKYQKRWSSRWIKSITRFSTSLEPYFGVVTLMVQSNPQFSALVWGGLRFIFQLASNHTTFFEKLIRILDVLQDALPQYGELAILAESDVSSRLASVTKDVYYDIFEFFNEVTKIFTSKSRLRRPVVVMGNLLWKPFHSRFEAILERMRNHRETIQMEVSIYILRKSNELEKASLVEAELAEQERIHANEARKIAEKTETQSKELRKLILKSFLSNLVRRIQEWLSPPEFTEIPRQAQKLREDGTNNWIFTHPQFRILRDSDWDVKSSGLQTTGEHGLWINGNPGTGKTVLASSILEELHDEIRSSSAGHDIYHFFFSHSDPRLAVSHAAYRAILAQILHRHSNDQALLDEFDFAMQGCDSSGSLIADSYEVETLFKSILGRLEGYILLDGVDECVNNTDLIDQISWLSNHTPVKIIFLGRPNMLKIQKVGPNISQLRLSRHLTGKDIEALLTRQMDLLYQEELLPPSADLANLTSSLLIGADGMFLWAKLMIQYLQSPALTPIERQVTISSVTYPEGLEVMYDRIIKMILGAGKKQAALARDILLWVSSSMEPITCDEVHDALTFKQSYQEGHRFKDFTETVVAVCGGLVECYEYKSHPCIRFIHLSVKEHFHRYHEEEQSWHGNSLYIPPAPFANSLILRTCLEYMTFYAPDAQPKSYTEAALRKSSIGSLARYASVNWTKHIPHVLMVTHLGTDGIAQYEHTLCDILGVVLRFVQDPLLVRYWIQIRYMCGTGDEPFLTRPEIPDICAIENLGVFVTEESRTCIGKFLKTIRTFAREMNELHAEWSSRLCAEPHLIWDEVGPLSRSAFIGTDSKSLKITSMAPKWSHSLRCHSQPLCTISKTVINRGMTGVLSVWPSVSYINFWKSRESYNDFSIPKHICERWLARYEVWKHDKTYCRVVDIDIPLSETEIALQLRHSVRHQESKTSFPLAISPDLKSFVVLRTVYSPGRIRKNGSTGYRSAVCPMNITSNARWQWDLSSPFEAVSSGNYFYHFCFSPDGTLLFFWDGLSSLKKVHSLAIFSVFNFDDAELAVYVEKNQPFPQAFRNLGYITRAVFHPSQAFLILCFQSSIPKTIPKSSILTRTTVASVDGYRLLLWNFSSPSSDFIELYLFHQNVEEIAFSPCGKFIVVHITDQPPSVIPIPEKHLPEGKSVTMTKREDSHQNTGLLQNGQNSSATTFPPPAEAGQAIPIHQEIYNKNDESLARISVCGGKAVAIKSWSTDTTKGPLKESLEIMKLPNVPSLSANIVMPSVNDEAVRVFIDQQPRDDYPIAASADAHYPVFVDRRKSAIRHFVNPNHVPEQAGSSSLTGLGKLMSIEWAPQELDSELSLAKRQKKGTKDETDDEFL